MGFERSPFGDNVTNTTSNVSNHYGQWPTGGESGVVAGNSAGYNEAIVNFDSAGPLYTVVNIPEGSVVRDIRATPGSTGFISAATVGTQDISGAVADDNTTWVTTDGTGGTELTVTGPTAGEVVVQYYKYVGS